MKKNFTPAFTLIELRVYSHSFQTGEVQKLYAEELPKYLLADAQKQK